MLTKNEKHGQGSNPDYQHLDARIT